MKKIECVIMDWAGTAVDYGCFAPVSAFIESFRAIGIEITAEEARRPMGLTKIDHVRRALSDDTTSERIPGKYGRPYNENDVQGRYAEFQRLLFATLKEYTGPISYVIETIDTLRQKESRLAPLQVTPKK